MAQTDTAQVKISEYISAILSAVWNSWGKRICLFFCLGVGENSQVELVLFVQPSIMNHQFASGGLTVCTAIGYNMS